MLLTNQKKLRDEWVTMSPEEIHEAFDNIGARTHKPYNTHNSHYTLDQLNGRFTEADDFKKRQATQDDWKANHLCRKKKARPTRATALATSSPRRTPLR